MMRGFWKFALLVTVNLMVVATASADMLPVSAVGTSDGTNTRYTYNIVLTTDSKLQSGDFFTIFDFPSPVLSSAQMPANWSVSAAPLGGDPAGTVPGDSPKVPNLTFTYTGPTVSGQTNLGSFSIDSPVSTSSNVPFSFASLTQQLLTGANESNITSLTVPVGTATTQGGGGTPAVPEPSTLLLMSIGLPLVGLARRLRSTQVAAA
jgi:hypothetical protein